jgi:hypothetical protein
MKSPAFKFRINVKIRLLFLLVFGVLITQASTLPPIYLTGDASSTVGNQSTYTYDNGMNHVGFTWYAPVMGTIISQSVSGTAYTCTIQWHSVGTGNLQAAYDVDIILPQGQKSVTITEGPILAPNTTFSITQNCNGTATITRNSGPPVGYTWYWQSSSSGTATNLGSGSTFTISSTTDVYLRTRSNSTSNWSSSAQGAGNITPYAALSAGSISGGQTLCQGTPVNAISNGSSGSGGAGPSYSWERSTNNVNWSAISGTSASLSSPPLVAGATNYFRRLTSTSCGNAYSNTITITAYAQLDGGSITGTQSICYNQATSVIQSTALASGGSGTNSYTWEQNSGSGWYWIDGLFDPNGLPAMNLTGTASFRRVMTNNCGSVTSNSITVTVSPQLTAGTAGQNMGGVCTGTAPPPLNNSTLPTGGTGTYSYQWQISTNGSSYSAIAGATSASYSPPVQTTPGTYYFRRAVTSCGQTLTSPAVTVTVILQPSPGSIQGNQSICLNATPNAILNEQHGGNGQSPYIWEYSTNGTVFYTIAGQYTATYQPGASSVPTWYRRALETSCGVVYTNVVFIDVYTPIQPGSINGTATICYNQSATLANVTPASGSTGSYTYTWIKDGNGISSTNTLSYTTPALCYGYLQKDGYHGLWK